jgi:hypothetical protein
MLKKKHYKVSRKRHNKIAKNKRNKISRKKSKRGGTDHVITDTSIPDDVCGIGWKFVGEPKIQSVISEKVYQTTEDRKLINILLSNNIPNEFNNYVSKICNLIDILYKINNKFEKAKPFTFMKTNIEKINENEKTKVKVELENNPRSWKIYALFDGSKDNKQDGYMTLERCYDIIDNPNIDIGYSEGSLLVQTFCSRILVIITMIILELDMLKDKSSQDENIAQLFNLLSEEDLNRRAKILEEFAWFSIDVLRDLYKRLSEEDAMRMVIGADDPKEWSSYSGFFGDCHLLGSAVWSKSAGNPKSRLNRADLGCYDIFIKNKKTDFWLNNNNLLFKPQDRKWWSQTTSLKRMKSENPDNVENYNKLFPEIIRKQIEPGVYINISKDDSSNPSTYIKYYKFDDITNNKAIITGNTADIILTDISNFKLNTVYIIINSEIFNINPTINKESRQIISENGEPINVGTGGKIFTVNEKSLAGLINKWRGTLAVAGPSGTSWFLLSTSLLFNDYKPGNNKKMIYLILSLIIGVCSLPHHSIEEVVLAASAPPIKAFNYTLNMTNEDAIKEITKHLGSQFTMECNPKCQELNRKLIARYKLPDIVYKMGQAVDRTRKLKNLAREKFSRYHRSPNQTRRSPQHSPGHSSRSHSRGHSSRSHSRGHSSRSHSRRSPLEEDNFTMI